MNHLANFGHNRRSESTKSSNLNFELNLWPNFYILIDDWKNSLWNWSDVSSKFHFTNLSSSIEEILIVEFAKKSTFSNLKVIDQCVTHSLSHTHPLNQSNHSIVASIVQNITVFSRREENSSDNWVLVLRIDSFI